MSAGSAATKCAARPCALCPPFEAARDSRAGDPTTQRIRVDCTCWRLVNAAGCGDRATVARCLQSLTDDASAWAWRPHEIDAHKQPEETHACHGNVIVRYAGRALTALLAAVLGDHTAVVRQLLAAGLALSRQPRAAPCPVAAACARGDAATLHCLCEAATTCCGEGLPTHRMEMEMPCEGPLTLLAADVRVPEERACTLLRMLVEHTSLNINDMGSTGRTAVVAAIEAHRNVVWPFLVTALHADLTAETDPDAHAPYSSQDMPDVLRMTLASAMRAHNIDAGARLVTQFGAPLQVALNMLPSESRAILSRIGPEQLDARSKHGLLMRAITGRDVALLRFLLRDMHIDPNTKSDAFSSSLITAMDEHLITPDDAESTTLDMLRLLLESGADVHAFSLPRSGDSSAHSPLGLIIYREQDCHFMQPGALAAWHLLFRFGVDPSRPAAYAPDRLTARDSQGPRSVSPISPLEWAARMNAYHSITLLHAYARLTPHQHTSALTTACHGVLYSCAQLTPLMTARNGAMRCTLRWALAVNAQHPKVFCIVALLHAGADVTRPPRNSDMGSAFQMALSTMTDGLQRTPVEESHSALPNGHSVTRRASLDLLALYSAQERWSARRALVQLRVQRAVEFGHAHGRTDVVDPLLHRGQCGGASALRASDLRASHLNRRSTTWTRRLRRKHGASDVWWGR